MTFVNTNGQVMNSGPGGWVTNPANVKILSSVPPSTAAVENRVGTIGVYPTDGSVYMVSKNTGLNGTVTWTALGGGSTAIATLTGDSGGAITPSAGDISLLGTANEITTTGTANTITWSLPAAITAPGSLTTTTTLTATLGDITATAGNFVCSAAGDALSLNITPASGATPQTQNGRAGQVTFTGVSIATNADSAFVIANTSITSASQVVLIGWSGATTGSALSIKSVVLDGTGHTITITMTNGDGAAIVTSVADITFTFLVLN